MATVIDALLVTLGLDAKGFTGGLKGVKGATTDAGKEVDRVTKQMASGFQRVRNEILGLYALVTAGRGIKTLIGDIVSGDAAIGRFAVNVGMSTENVSAWQKVVERAGGSAGEFTAQAGQLGQELQRMQLTGTSGVVPYFLQMGVALRDINTGKIREVDEILRDMAKWSEQHPELSQARKLAVFAGAGINGGVAQSLLQGRAALDRQLEEQRKLGVTKPEDAKRAQELHSQLVQLQTAFEELMRRVISTVTPTILKVMASLTQALQDNMPKISAAIDEFARRIAAFDWSGLITNAGRFATEADNVAQALGGWVKITEVLFGMWAAGKVLGLIGSITRVGGAIAGVGLGAGGAAGGVGKVAGLGRLAVGTAATGMVAGTLLAMLGFDPRKLLPETLQDALGTGRPGTPIGGRGEPPGPRTGSDGDGRHDRDAYAPVPDQRTALERSRLGDETLEGISNAPGKVLAWLGRQFRVIGTSMAAGAGQGQAPDATGFTPSQKEDLFLRFQQFLDEEERARKAVAAARAIATETARGTGPGTIPGAGPFGGQDPGTGIAPGNSNARPSEAARRAYAFWISKGYTPSGAAGMVARMMKESGGDPGARGDRRDPKDPSTATAFGLYQHHLDRVTKMKNATGIDVRTATFEQQLEAKYQESLLGLDAGAGRAYSRVKNANDPATAGAIVSLEDIRPGMTAAKRQEEAAQTARDARRYQSLYGPSGGQPAQPSNNVVPFTPGALRTVNNQSSATDNSTSVNTGNITIHTQATDAGGLARDFQKELQRRSFSSQANTGLR